MLRILIIVTGLGLSSFALVAKDKPKSNEEAFAATRSMLEATERRLAVEDDPYRRLQLILRWIKIKEEVEQFGVLPSDSPERVERLRIFKTEIVDRLRLEVRNYEQLGMNKPEVKLDYNSLYRELGVRLLELQKYSEAASVFEKMKVREPEDDIAYGDALFADNKTVEAMDAYRKAGLDAKLRGMSAYKLAWGYMRFNDFHMALGQFDVALSSGTLGTVALREEAFRDRLKPYIETHSKPTFDKADRDSFIALSALVFPGDPKKQKDVLINTLERLVEGFNGKAAIDKSLAAFGFLREEVPNPQAVLLAASPQWLKIYRGQLNHTALEGVIDTLPNEPVDMSVTAAIRAEFNNTALFYENLLADRDEANAELIPKFRGILMKIYAKYFKLFPKDLDADSIRVSYATHLLEDGDAEACINLLATRSKQDAAIEESALNLEGKCELKYVDQLYNRPHTDVFYTKLNDALIVKKSYQRKDLGVPSEEAFDGLITMMTGALKKDSSNPKLRETLSSVIKEFPYPAMTRLINDLQTVRSELSFQDAVKESSKEKSQANADEFYKIYQEAPKGTDVSRKSLVNSVVLGTEEVSRTRCRELIDMYPQEFAYESGPFKRCIELAEEQMSLEDEAHFWLVHARQLNVDQMIHLSLLEMSLGNESGRKRIHSIKNQKAVRALELWDGHSEKRVVKKDPLFERRMSDINDFIKTLKRVHFAAIGREVPARIRAFEAVDKTLVAYVKADREPIYRAKIFENRAKMAVRMAAWMKNLPTPSGLKPAELDEYKLKTQAIVAPWEEGATARRTECSQTAYALSEDIKALSPELCPEQTSETTFAKFMAGWEKTRLGKNRGIFGGNEKSKKLESLIEKAKGSDALKARYYLIHALDFASNNYDKSLVTVELAKLTNKDRFWLSAYELNGDWPEPIKWKLDQADGNPFFMRLYSEQLSKAK